MNPSVPPRRSSGREGARAGPPQRVGLALDRLRRRHRQRNRLRRGQRGRALDRAELRFGADVGQAVHHVAGAERQAEQQDGGGIAGQPGGGRGGGTGLGHLPDSLPRWAVLRRGRTSTATLSTTTELTTLWDWLFMTRTSPHLATASRIKPSHEP